MSAFTVFSHPDLLAGADISSFTLLGQKLLHSTDNYSGEGKREGTKPEVSLPEFMKAVYDLGRTKYNLCDKEVDALVEEAARLNEILNGAEERDREFKDIQRRAEYTKKEIDRKFEDIQGRAKRAKKRTDALARTL